MTFNDYITEVAGWLVAFATSAAFSISVPSGMVTFLRYF